MIDRETLLSSELAFEMIRTIGVLAFGYALGVHAYAAFARAQIAATGPLSVSPELLTALGSLYRLHLTLGAGVAIAALGTWTFYIGRYGESTDE